ncbi:FAD-dependent oxidoreductase [Herbiconiux sp. KACC 21604]|uniref:FAD-dependent oxidoreductase n=1 Tax=unclassified Herbiconiux TaxID=2618217 RepID=UPI00149120D6|nr:FAD-dependent oxidoreductase [Herbiconiux sp. SALV-R1]QJU55125.1 FAD-dependent oxidoreductase [Herbiconiux sp. SALV-R1]WPO86275.1 FAD-dependent oxidoreductase [Herbiconiux sp. KACC 21604]
MSAQRIAVVGGGVVGVTTAWSLLRRGHSVDLYEREETAATGATASNAGLIVPGDSLVWGTPSAIGMLARSLLARKQSFIRVRAGAGPSLVPWGLRFLRECLPSRMRRNVRAAHALSSYSLDRLQELQAELGLDFSFEANGMAFLAGSPEHLAALAEERGQLAAAGERYESYAGARFTEVDPGFAAAATGLGGVLYTTGSAHGDARAFTLQLLQRAVDGGLTVHSATEVRAIESQARAVTGLVTPGGSRSFDAVVLAAGARTAELARTAGLRLPILPAKGYAATVPIRPGASVADVGGVDERAHVAFSRMGDALRLSSTAEFAGYDSGSNPGDYDSIRATGDRLFPGALDWAGAEFHVGWRPATPDGNPILGRTALRGLYVNSGHGHLGWTQAAGSAEIVADQIDGIEPAIDTQPYRTPRGRTRR